MGSRPNRVIAAVELLKAEAFELEQDFNRRYPLLVTDGRITQLLGLSHRIRLLRHLANQIESI